MKNLNDEPEAEVYFELLQSVYRSHVMQINNLLHYIKSHWGQTKVEGMGELRKQSAVWNTAINCDWVWFVLLAIRWWWLLLLLWLFLSLNFRNCWNWRISFLKKTPRWLRTLIRCVILSLTCSLCSLLGEASASECESVGYHERHVQGVAGRHFHHQEEVARVSSTMRLQKRDCVRNQLLSWFW